MIMTRQGDFAIVQSWVESGSTDKIAAMLYTSKLVKRHWRTSSESNSVLPKTSENYLHSHVIVLDKLHR